jgi:hypothetical protein
VASIISGCFNLIGKPIKIKPSLEKDSVQMNKQNEADLYITSWWIPETTINNGIVKVFNVIKRKYDQ